MSTLAHAPLLGPYFSAVIATALYGVTCMQTFFYYVHYQNDVLRIKIFVATVWMLNTTHEALIVSGTYRYFLDHWQNISPIITPTPELTLQLNLTALLAVVTQGFFVHRLYIFSGKNIIAPLVWVGLAVIQIATSLTYAIKSLYSDANGVHVVPAAELADDSFTTLFTLCIGVSAGVDVLISVFLTFILVRMQSQIVLTSTANMLQRLTMFAVNTGIWPAVFAILTIILSYLYPSSWLYTIFAVPISAVYCNTLLANLNARSYVRDGWTKHNNGDFFHSSGPPVFNSTKPDEHDRVQPVLSTHQTIFTTTETIRFPGASQPAENV